MPATIINKGTVDVDGRNIIRSDNVVSIRRYDCSNEVWDKAGTGNQSWYNELYNPSDNFDNPTIYSDRWSIINTANSLSSVFQDNKLVCNVKKSGGIVGITSDGKWKLSGDFEVWAYLDWSVYYNEFRSITDTYLKILVNGKNAIRVAFSWTGSAYVYRSQKTVNKDIRFFDWTSNGSALNQASIGTAKTKNILKIKRQGSSISCFISNGSVDTLLGSVISDPIFSNDVSVELGNECREYNSAKNAFSKVKVFGTIAPTTKFFSGLRGELQRFPERSLLVVDNNGLSIIDEDNFTLWMRFSIGNNFSLPAGTVRFSALNGVIYAATTEGILAIDFHNDCFLLYKNGNIYKSLDGIALRNSIQTYILHTSSIGTFPSGAPQSVFSKRIIDKDVIAFTTTSGVGVFSPMASGVSYSLEGTIPAEEVFISDRGYLYWSGYDRSANYTQLSYRSSLYTLPSGTFSRTGFYDANTAHSIFGAKINNVDVKTISDSDLIAVGTTEGISFLSFVPGGNFHGTHSYGIETSGGNLPDPSFEGRLGITWKTEYTGFHEKFSAQRSSEFVSGLGSYGLKMFFNPPVSPLAAYPSGTLGGVYQNVNVDNIDYLYFDVKISRPTAGFEINKSVWEAKIMLDDVVLKSYKDLDGPFVRMNDSINLIPYTGTKKISIALHINGENGSVNELSDRLFFIDNFRANLSIPDFSILPKGQANVQDVLLQFDSGGHKIYFSTPEGYGALDLENNTLDYFNYVSGIIEGAVINATELTDIVE